MFKFRYRRLLRAVSKLPKADGITPANVLLLPDPLGGVFGQMMRDREMLLEEFANALHLHPDDAYSIGGILVEKGYFALEEQDDERGLKYRVNFAPMRKRDLPEL